MNWEDDMKRILAKILVVLMVCSVVMIPLDNSEAYTGYTKVGKYYYYFDSNGVMQKYSQTINGKPYYFESNGRGAAKRWVNTGGNKRYSLGNGKLATGYTKVGKYYYYFDSKGIMKKYSQTVNGKPYYFENNGRGAAKRWINTGGNKRYSLGNGKLATGYTKVGKYYYYFDANGVMTTFSQTINGKPYYFESNGRGASKRWINNAALPKRYSLGNGKLAIGHLKVGNINYVFDSNGFLVPKIILQDIPDKAVTEYAYAGKNYKGHCQVARNYKGYNDYLAAHGCGSTTLTNVLCTYIPECREWTPYETIEIAERSVAGDTIFTENYSKPHASQMPITLYGTTKVLNRYGINHVYVPSFSSDVAVKSDIISHLQNGYPVIFIISQKNRETGKKTNKWTGSFHTMLMIGADNNENVLIVNPAGSSRFQLVSVDEMIDYMWSCSKTPNSFYWNAKARCGGYIKLME